MKFHANTLHILYTDGEVFIRTYDDFADLLKDVSRLGTDIAVKAITMYYQSPV